MSNELVSILLPFFNGSEFIEDAINSVLEQDYKNIELIVIDDCSKIEEREYIKKLQQQKKFILLHNDVNLGCSKSLKKAFDISKGDYISIISHDDIYSSDKISYSIKKIIENDLDVVYCNGTQFTDSINSSIPFDSIEVLQAQNKGQKYVAELISSRDNIGSLLTQGALYKRNVWKELNWMREKFLLDDWPFTIKVWQEYKTMFFDHVVYHYRFHENNIHKNYWKWLPARMQTVVELVEESKRLNVLSFIFFDIAYACLNNKSIEKSVKFALASYFLTDRKDYKRKIRKYFIYVFIKDTIFLKIYRKIKRILKKRKNER